ncbi:TPA: hypothetical protein ACN31Q_000456 [Vibrio campbellii]
MKFIIAEARVLTQKNREWTNPQTGEVKTWVEYNLKVEEENGSDVYLQVPKALITDENIEYLQNLKGQEVTCEFWLNHNKQYLTYYLSNLPVIKD